MSHQLICEHMPRVSNGSCAKDDSQKMLSCCAALHFASANTEMQFCVTGANVEKFKTPELAFQEVRCLQMIHSRSV